MKKGLFRSKVDVYSYLLKPSRLHPPLSSKQQVLVLDLRLIDDIRMIVVVLRKPVAVVTHMSRITEKEPVSQQDAGERFTSR
jgi:hypothetical protein